MGSTGRHAACLVVALLLVGCGDTELCQNCSDGSPETCPSSPTLNASASDREVTLTWEPAGGARASVQAWQYRQAVQGQSWTVMRSTGPAANAYVVSALTNGVAYTFQIRAQLKSGSGCWSEAVTVVPRRIVDVMERIEKHQRAIAERMAEVVKGMADRQELLKELGEQGVATLGAVATSTGEIAKHSAGISGGVAKVATNVEAAGKDVATATAAVAQEAASIRDEVHGLKVSVDAVGQNVAEGLAEVAAQVGKVCGGCQVLPANCRPLGRVLFPNDSPHPKDDENWRDLEQALNALDGFPEQQNGLLLNVGYATSVGPVVHNLHLSDRRAACVSRCLDRSLGDRFTFMEVAKGEVLDISDPEGTGDGSDENRRVDVIFCPDHPTRGPDDPKLEAVRPDVSECICPGMPT